MRYCWYSRKKSVEVKCSEVAFIPIGLETQQVYGWVSYSLYTSSTISSAEYKDKSCSQIISLLSISSSSNLLYLVTQEIQIGEIYTQMQHKKHP